MTGINKENLFWKWTEIVEQERDKDGGFSEAGQQKFMERVRDEFERQGVDFEEIVNKIGGLEEVKDAAVKQ